MTMQIQYAAPDFQPETTEGAPRLQEWIGASWKSGMKRIVVVPLVAIVSLAGVQFVSPVLAHHSTAQAGSLQRDLLVPPHLFRVDSRATRVYWGMSAVEVERTLGAAADEETYQGKDGNVRVLSYPGEPIAAEVTISDGKVSAVALDIAGIDERRLPPYSRSAWLGMHRTTVLQLLGEPADDRFYDRYGVKLEHMIFERLGQPDVSIFFIGERVATKKIGRCLPPDILAFALPLTSYQANQETDTPGTARDNEQVRVGMTRGDVQILFGSPRLSVPSSFKGRPAEYAIFETGPDESFARFTFIDGVLVEFSDGGSTRLSQILVGG